MTPRLIVYCLLGGLPMTLAAMGVGHFGLWWLAGILMAAAFVPVARFGPRGMWRQLGVLAPVLLVVTVLCTWSEAVIFVPSFTEHPVRDLAGSAVMYLVVAVVLAGLASALGLTTRAASPPTHRPMAAAALMVLACGVAYAIYYLVFGAITYEFFTRPYYPDAAQIAQRLGLWFWAIQIGRGALMTLAVVPVIYTLSLPRWQTAVATGVIVWVAGGAAPLIPPNEFMGTAQRLIHVVEIFTQNAALGVTAALLLRPAVTASGDRATVAARTLGAA